MAWEIALGAAVLVASFLAGIVVGRKNAAKITTAVNLAAEAKKTL
jgi:hypothetical protein